MSESDREASTMSGPWSTSGCQAMKRERHFGIKCFLSCETYRLQGAEETIWIYDGESDRRLEETA